jgi:hypothetical protein
LKIAILAQKRCRFKEDYSSSSADQTRKKKKAAPRPTMHLRYHCNGPASSLRCLGDRMAFYGFIIAREKPRRGRTKSRTRTYRGEQREQTQGRRTREHNRANTGKSWEYQRTTKIHTKQKRKKKKKHRTEYRSINKRRQKKQREGEPDAERDREKTETRTNKDCTERKQKKRKNQRERKRKEEQRDPKQAIVFVFASLHQVSSSLPPFYNFNSLDTVHYHFNSPVTVYARVSWFTRAASSQPGHWLGPVTRLGRLGPAQTIGLIWTQPKKKKQIICPIPFILFLFVLILIRTNKSLFYIIKFQINLLTLLNLFVSLALFFFW